MKVLTPLVHVMNKGINVAMGYLPSGLSSHFGPSEDGIEGGGTVVVVEGSLVVVEFAVVEGLVVMVTASLVVVVGGLVVEVGGLAEVVEGIVVVVEQPGQL